MRQYAEHDRVGICHALRGDQMYTRVFSGGYPYIKGGIIVQSTSLAPNHSYGKNYKKKWTVRIKELEISTPPLPDEEMDPHMIFASVKSEVHFWSNNVPYAITPNGTLRQVLLPQEVAMQNQEWHQLLYGRRYYLWRVLFLCVLILSGVCVIWVVMRKREQLK